MALGLSYLTWHISPGDLRTTYHWRCDNRTRYTSGAPKKIRGLVQACLAILAREGIMFSRTRPECGVASWSHGETDKYFSVRISKEEATRRLASMK